MTYNVASLKTPKDCTIVMERARKIGNDVVYSAAFQRFCELSGRLHDDPSDPIVREFYEILAAYEQLLSEKNGRRQPAGRTRQKLQNKGLMQCLIDWALSKEESEGFKLLVGRGMPQSTAEYLVVKHANRFSPEVVQAARARLIYHNIDPPSSTTPAHQGRFATS